MRRLFPSGMITLVLGSVALAPAAAYAQQSADAAARPAAVSSLLRDIAMVEEKIVTLGEAIPEDRYEWRPGEGVRSIGEVLVHVAADNWFLPTAIEVAAPEATGIKAGDYPSVQAYEGRSMSKAETLQAVRESFAHLRTAMEAADEAMLGRTLNLFGSEMMGVDLWVITTTHLHEHLGQLIAYARSNDIVPPWSR